MIVSNLCKKEWNSNAWATQEHIKNEGIKNNRGISRLFGTVVNTDGQCKVKNLNIYQSGKKHFVKYFRILVRSSTENVVNDKINNLSAIIYKKKKNSDYKIEINLDAFKYQRLLLNEVQLLLKEEETSLYEPTITYLKGNKEGLITSITYDHKLPSKDLLNNLNNLLDLIPDQSFFSPKQWVQSQTKIFYNKKNLNLEKNAMIKIESNRLIEYKNYSRAYFYDYHINLDEAIDKCSSLKINIDNKDLAIPETVNMRLLYLLSESRLQGFCCLDFVNYLCNKYRMLKVIFSEDWSVYFDDLKYSSGDVILFCNYEENISDLKFENINRIHFAINIGTDLFASVLCDDGPIVFSNMQEIKAFYSNATKVLKLKPV